ncbi:MAG: hypothetical protein A2825_03910 [Candidatus Taylorbacteria bacterium RIFCSPHIGHO2_01_FULL_43_120]|nr:MAG: hypothetical protein A2825_03910 [Candidatus Taylorbacteria bacterium RIFCSPHIGHO2_01_FULL_43_120]
MQLHFKREFSKRFDSGQCPLREKFQSGAAAGANGDSHALSSSKDGPCYTVATPQSHEVSTEEAGKVFLQKIKNLNANDAQGLSVLLAKLTRRGFDGDTLAKVANSKVEGGDLRESYFSSPEEKKDQRLEKFRWLSTDENGFMGNLTVGEARTLLKENGYITPEDEN